MNSKWRDNIRILSKTTPLKAWNSLKLTSSFHLSRLIGKNLHRGQPSAMSIEPTTSCNLRCPECPSGLRSFTRPTGMIDMPLFRSAIDQTAKYLNYLTLYFQGEPFLHPQFYEMVNYAVGKKIYVATSTNAHYLSEENAIKTVQSGLNRLIISIDGTTQDTYASYRVGGSLHKVIEGTKNILEARKQLKKKTPHIIFQFLVVKPNEHQIAEVKNLARELGVDEMRFKTAQIYDYRQGSDLIPTDEKYSRYKKQADGTYIVKNEIHRNCWKMWQSCVMTWDGKIVPCCFDKDAKYEMGTINRASFRSIWRNQAYSDFRETLVNSRKEIEMCKNCSEGTKVWA